MARSQFFTKDEERIRETLLILKDWQCLSVKKPITLNRNILQMIIEEIVILKQERQITAIVIIKITGGVITSSRGIIQTLLSSNE